MNYDNPAFCVLPFIHKHTRLSGESTLCCNSQLPVKPDYVNIIREKLLTGEKINHCRRLNCDPKQDLHAIYRLCLCENKY